MEWTTMDRVVSYYEALNYGKGGDWGIEWFDNRDAAIQSFANTYGAVGVIEVLDERIRLNLYGQPDSTQFVMYVDVGEVRHVVLSLRSKPLDGDRVKTDKDAPRNSATAYKLLRRKVGL
jgi:hypothetical protein